MVVGVDALTDVVVMVKAALVEPAGTLTLDGVVAALELSESDTTAPPLGAAALNVTVPAEELPPTTVVGLTETAASDALGADWFTVMSANWNTLSSAAESWTVVGKLGNVVTVKLALVAPPGIVTLAGTLAESGRLLARLTATPTGGAALASLTVPVAELPPPTVVGLTVIDVSAGRLGYKVRGCDSVTPPPLTEIVTVVGAVTGAVAMSK
jgi:hypothetical protein